MNRRRIILMNGQEDDGVKEWVDYGVKSVDGDDAVAYFEWDVPKEISELYLVGTIVSNTADETGMTINSENKGGVGICYSRSLLARANNKGKTQYLGVYLKKITPENLWHGMGDINVFSPESCSAFIGRGNQNEMNTGKIFFKTMWGVNIMIKGTSIRLYAR